MPLSALFKPKVWLHIQVNLYKMKGPTSLLDQVALYKKMNCLRFRVLPKKMPGNIPLQNVLPDVWGCISQHLTKERNGTRKMSFYTKCTVLGFCSGLEATHLVVEIGTRIQLLLPFYSALI